MCKFCLRRTTWLLWYVSLSTMAANHSHYRRCRKLATIERVERVWQHRTLEVS